MEARRLLEMQRATTESDDDDDDDNVIDFDESKEKDSVIDHSHDFALELAYIIEHYSEESEAEAKGILDLYMEGANSIMLAVSYAQRQREYSAVLWEKLIQYCLSKTSSPRSGKSIQDTQKDGMLFGSLLEAAALCGADLARLVAKIPPGMVVVGLRPRLVAAVADYRLKLDIHQAAATASSEDRIALLREVTHRSRRGLRYEQRDFRHFYSRSNKVQQAIGDSKRTRMMSASSNQDDQLARLRKTIRPRERRDRYSLTFSIPMR